ncbi:hypothetical protein JQX13_53130 [Archangium violaceum]|jgi:hypothetical protein|uniref:hypothetical protein n=1 Tax=Archangium violaceum TaxID=83451 RepID=UPI00193B93FF|nr:hypothetical protein [Archangium violaceum]QRK08547.1 hypothetical protein JQX13_53130 [Archangium violaceum]
MRRVVKVFIIPTQRGPAAPPEPAPEFTVEARTEDGLLDAARTELASRGYRLRSLSFSPTGLVAYMEGHP